MKVEKRPGPERLNRRYERLRARLAKVGWVLQGTITQRYDDRVPAGNPPRGPYPQWTFKRHGKTVTVNLAPGQVKAFQTAIDNHRKAERILQEMRDLSLQYLDTTTRGPKRRKSKK
jgi:hypothetical protein